MAADVLANIAELPNLSILAAKECLVDILPFSLDLGPPTESDLDRGLLQTSVAVLEACNRIEPERTS